MRDLTSIRFSDGILFSEFLTGIFTKELPLALANDPKTTYQQLVTLMALQLAEYLLGERKLLHPSTGMEITVSNIPSPNTTSPNSSKTAVKATKIDLHICFLLPRPPHPTGYLHAKRQ